MVVDGFKFCPKCEQSKLVEHFYRVRRKTGDGFSGYCKVCQAAKAVAWQKDNPDSDKIIRDRRLAKIASERASWPEEKKAKVNAIAKRWRDNNVAKSRQIQRDAKKRAKERDPETFRANHAMQCGKRRCLMRGYPSDVTIDDWKKLLETFNRQCPFCGGRPKFFDLDHLVPIHMGGFNVVGNIVPICRPCNSQKSKCDPYKFAREMNIELAPIIEKARVRESTFPTCAETYQPD
jgi:5-methylcytosine-specific restriction endonuclease McrA